MNHRVIDTNVMVAADDSEPPTSATHLSLACRQNAVTWLRSFLQFRHRLVIDLDHKILSEYRRNVQSGGNFRSYFLRDTLQLALVDWVRIVFDTNGHAQLPEELVTVVHDYEDRKFVAVALAHGHRPPIVNAADTDWLSCEHMLQRYNIECIHICEQEPQRKAAEKKERRRG